MIPEHTRLQAIGTLPFLSSTQKKAIPTTYQPEFNGNFIKRLLGKKKDQQLSRSTYKRMERIKGQLKKITRPRVTYAVQGIIDNTKGTVTLEDGTKFKSAKLAFALKNARRVIMFVATVGDRVDQKIKQLMQERKIADAYVADALGSGAIEHTADRFQAAIADQLQQIGQTVGLRFSPGYCDWPVTEQANLFSLLDADTVGVSLGETSLMSPRKSISAVFGIYDREVAPKIPDQNPCLYCTKKDCFARRTPRKTPT